MNKIDGNLFNFRVFVINAAREHHLVFGSDDRAEALERSERFANRVDFLRSVQRRRELKDALKVTVVDCNGVTIRTVPVAAGT